MQKTRYEVDPYNRLVLARSGKPGDLRKFRQVLDGRFNIDGNNDLSYHIKAPLSKGESIPHQIKLKGKWSLTDNHDLNLTLDKSARKTFGDQVVLRGDILDAAADSLSFAVMTITKAGTRSTYILNLEGSWKADESNRLSFHARKEKGKYDILTFGGAWEIGKNHEIIYRYEKAELLVKKRRTHELLFRGHWDIRGPAFRISYVLSGDTDSVFDFEARAGKFEKDYIRYEIGVGLTNRPDARTIVLKLSGKWNLKKDTGLVFEIRYRSNSAREIVFGADAKITDNDTISFRLKDGVENKYLGIELELDRKIMKGDGEAFFSLLKSQSESAIYAGAAWRW